MGTQTSQIRNSETSNWTSRTSAVQTKISGFGFEIRDWFNFKLLRRVRYLLVLPLAVLVGTPAFTHDIITTPVTWNREISRIFYSRCAACHREGGRAFSLMEYQETFPWRTAIKEEILERRMPPWGAVKGFGDFRNDQALTPEQLELVTSWSQGGSPEGEAKDLPPKDKLDEMMKESVWYGNPAEEDHRAGEIMAKGDFKLTKGFLLDGLFPKTVPENASFQILAEFPDGRIEPLLWLDGYNQKFAHSFLLRAPIDLPAGTMITGIPSGATIALLPAPKD